MQTAIRHSHHLLVTDSMGAARLCQYRMFSLKNDDGHIKAGVQSSLFLIA
jgi:hypothetical protein